MADLKMCRICLRRNVKLFHYNWFQLKKFYEELIDLEIIDKNKLPKYFCFECAAMLHKFHKFKEKCFKGHNILLDVLKNTQTTLKIIRELDGKELQPQLDILTVSEKVKTITIKNRAKLFHIKETTDRLKNEGKSETEPIFVNANVEEESKSIQKLILFVNEDKITEDSVAINIDDNISNETVAKINDNDTDEKLNGGITDDNIIENSKMVVDDDDRTFSSDDDNVLSELVNEKRLKEETIEDAPKVVEARKDIKKKKKVKGTPVLKRITEEKKPPKITLDSKYWERKYLNEEEAEREFKKRAQDPKYLAAAYQCTDCFKGFSQEDMLIRHNRKKHAESLGPNLCLFCHSRFKWNCHLTRHMHQHYNIYKCLRCHLVCNLESTALLHEEHHNGIVKKCEYCGEEYTHTSTYYSHLRSHRSSFVCTLCGQSFVSETGLRYHKILKHIHMDPKEPEKNAEEEEEEEDTYCERCKIKFETREAYEQHYLHSAMHSVGTAVQGAEDTPAPTLIKARTRTIKRSPRKPRTCPTCETTFRTQTAFFQHRCIEHKPSAVGAAECTGRAFKGPTGRSYKNAEKQMCEICGITVAAVYMEQHINTHTHQKAYPCSVCGVKLYAQSSLKRHQLTHTGERPYPCPLCDKRFTQSNSMKLHYRTFHLKEPYPKRNRRKKDDSSIIEFST